MKSKRWIGRWLLAVGIVHTTLGFVFMGDALKILWDEGLFNTVNGQPERELPFWFIFSGLMMMLVGALVDHDEARGRALPGWLGWVLAGLVLICLVVMPISGGWLILPPAIGAILRGRSTSAA